MSAVTTIKGVVISKQPGEVLANLQSMLVKKVLKIIKSGVGLTSESLTANGIIVSKSIGVCHCQLTMPVVSIDVADCGIEKLLKNLDDNQNVVVYSNLP